MDIGKARLVGRRARYFTDKDARLGRLFLISTSPEGAIVTLDLSSLALAALEHAGARMGPTPGAKIANSMAAIAKESQFDYRRAMRSKGLTLKTLLRTFPDVRILDHDRGDFQAVFADALASISTETPAPSRSKPRYLRKDVFDAFTRLAAPGFSYLLDKDEFVPSDEAPTPFAIPVPQASLEDLILMRRNFALTLQGENHEASELLINALEHGTALATFRSILSQTPFESAWRDYQSEQLRPKILAWAAERSILVREAWFEPSGSRRVNDLQSLSLGTERSALRQVIDRLTEDELRSIMLPLRAVERLLEGR